MACGALKLSTRKPPYQADVAGLPDLMQTGACPSRRHVCACLHNALQPRVLTTVRASQIRLLLTTIGSCASQISIGAPTGAIRSSSSPVSRVRPSLRCGTCTHLKRHLSLRRSSRGAAQHSRAETSFLTCRCHPLEVLMNLKPTLGRSAAMGAARPNLCACRVDSIPRSTGWPRSLTLGLLPIEYCSTSGYTGPEAVRLRGRAVMAALPRTAPSLTSSQQLWARRPG